MPLSAKDRSFASKLAGMPEEEFLQEWHAANTAGDQARIALCEGQATHRFGIVGWQQRYAARFPDQTHYQVPTP